VPGPRVGFGAQAVPGPPWWGVGVAGVGAGVWAPCWVLREQPPWWLLFRVDHVLAAYRAPRLPGWGCRGGLVWWWGVVGCWLRCA
jgi:hypothetical protein